VVDLFWHFCQFIVRIYMDDLTPKQRAFVIAYRASGNATDAAREAGYSGNDVTLGSTGYENLKKPQIKAALREMEIADLPKIATSNEVLETLTEIIRDREYFPPARIKAAELLGKRFRLWEPEPEKEKGGSGVVKTVPRGFLSEAERIAAASALEPTT